MERGESPVSRPQEGKVSFLISEGKSFNEQKTKRRTLCARGLQNFIPESASVKRRCSPSGKREGEESRSSMDREGKGGLLSGSLKKKKGRKKI